MNQEQKKEAKKLPGFYIALCCCVLVIGVAGYFTERHANKASDVINSKVTQEDEDKSVFSSDETEEPSVFIPSKSPDTSEAEGTYAKAPSDANASVPVISEDVEEYVVDNPDIDDSAIVVSSEQPTFIMPVTGNILSEYSDKLIYNNALSDWRTHDGVDIAAEKGCSVQSAASGVIESVSEDAMGKYVVISHAAGFTTKYMGLESTENLTVGKEIQSGEVIGTVGDCKGENITEPHLHFEIIKDNNSVNPSEYLPQ